MPGRHVHTINDNKKVPETAILEPSVHFRAHRGLVNRLRERREVVLDRIHVCRDHFHSPRGNIHPAEEAVKVSERRIHGPKSSVFPIDGHERLPFDRKEVVPDHVHVCPDHFHVPGEKIPVRKGSIHSTRDHNRRHRGRAGLRPAGYAAVSAASDVLIDPVTTPSPRIGRRAAGRRVIVFAWQRYGRS